MIVNTVTIPVEIPKDDLYVTTALKKRVKYCRIIRIPWKKCWLYKLQLVMEGTPPEKMHPMGEGRVGLDIGTQTLAISSNTDVSLIELADKANLPDRELRQLNRAMDRSRRANNPQFFNKDGTIIPLNKLPSNLLDSRGRRKWKESKHYQQLTQRRRYLYAKLARIRKWQHQTMANKLLKLGNKFYVEKMSFKGLAKPQEERKPGEKCKRRKRFGKSVANKAPY